MWNKFKKVLKEYFKGFPWDDGKYNVHMDMISPKFYRWKEWERK